ncbi:hypothetical protein JCM11251_002491 [Rhodosporidiobolus azoricus]
MKPPRRSAKPPTRLGFTTASATCTACSPASLGEPGSTPAMETSEEDEIDTNSSEETEDPTTDEDDLYSPLSRRPPKRPRKASAPRVTSEQSHHEQKRPAQGSRKQKSSMSSFAQLPLDIVLQIARYVDPIALVSLSRTSKATRSALVSKSSASVWTAVRDAAGLPQMTTGRMSDRELILFMLDKKCMICHEAKGVIVDLNFKVRFCKPCQLKMIVPLHAVHERHGKAFPHSYFQYAHTPVGSTDQVSYTFLPAARALVSRLYRMANSPGQLREFAIERAIYQERAGADGDALQDFLEEEGRRKKEEAQKFTIARKEAIILRLEALGYEKRDFCVGPTIENLVNHPRPLTDAIWKRISPDIIEAVEESRNQRLHAEAERLRREENRRNERRRREEDHRKRMEEVRIAEARRHAIIAKVKDLGFEQQDLLNAPTLRKLLDQPLALSDAAWEEIRTEVISGVEAQRDQRLLRRVQMEEELARKTAAAVAEIDVALSAPTSTIHARYVGILSNVASKYGTADQDLLERCIKNPSIPLTIDDYTAISSPYLHYISCRGCQEEHPLFSLTDFIKHKASAHATADAVHRAEPLGGFSAHDHGTFVDGHWTAALAGALGEAGLPLDVSGAEAPEKLEAFGEAWYCMCDTPSRRVHCGELGQRRLKWSEMLQHDFDKHRRYNVRHCLRVEDKVVLKLDRSILSSANLPGSSSSAETGTVAPSSALALSQPEKLILASTKPDNPSTSSDVSSISAAEFSPSNIVSKLSASTSTDAHSLNPSTATTAAVSSPTKPHDPEVGPMALDDSSETCTLSHSKLSDGSSSTDLDMTRTSSDPSDQAGSGAD